MKNKIVKLLPPKDGLGLMKIPIEIGLEPEIIDTS